MRREEVNRRALMRMFPDWERGLPSGTRGSIHAPVYVNGKRAGYGRTPVMTCVLVSGEICPRV